MLSDTDIKKYLGNGIEIEPFVQTSLSPIGYDFRVGDWAFSLKQRKEYDVKTKGRVVVKPGDTVVIRTLESMRLSCEFGATVHSMVSLLTEGGISHISTTVDPTHTGKLLIQFHNQSVDPVVLTHKRPFCTVCFYHMDSPAGMRSPHEQSRIRLEESLLRSAHKVPFHRRATIRSGAAGLSIIIIGSIAIWQFASGVDAATIGATASVLALISYIAFKEFFRGTQ
jgi:deoxycytidine triphosphate deaminase